jgi:hypothetical protein
MVFCILICQAVHTATLLFYQGGGPSYDSKVDCQSDSYKQAKNRPKDIIIAQNVKFQLKYHFSAVSLLMRNNVSI